MTVQEQERIDWQAVVKEQEQELIVALKQRARRAKRRMKGNASVTEDY